jgi:WD40 repeat protein
MRPSENPFVGPNPFELQDQPRFFGRDREIGELSSLVLAHPLTLLVATSGAGKTSLINAGMIPRLNGSLDGIPRCEVLPVVRFRQESARDDGSARFENRFIAYACSALGPDADALPPGKPGDLVELLQARPHAVDRFGQALPRLLVFDQFEELFTLYPQHWEERLPFLEELIAVDEADPLARILLSMREEFLARLEQVVGVRLADRLRIRLHLERLDRDHALLAVTEPLPADVQFAAGVAEELVDELRREASATGANGGAPEGFLGRYVEPVQLQVVCRALWNALPEGTAVITSELRKEYGSVDRALEEFYASAVAAAAGRDESVEEGIVRHWIEDNLISSRLTRNTVPLDEAERSGIPAAVLDALVNEHVLRREDRFNFPWYELTHDRLIAPVMASNAAWFTDNPDPLYAIQQQTRQWLREGKQDGYLLTGEPLAEASGFARTRPDLLTRDELEFVRLSENLQREYDETERSRRRFRNLAAIFLGLTALMVVLALLAGWQYREARRQKDAAEREQQISLARAVASQAMLANARSQDDLAALLSRQAYLFDEAGEARADTGAALQATVGSPYFSRLIDTGHAWVSSVAFSPDGARLATAGGDRGDSTVSIWSLAGDSREPEVRLVDPAIATSRGDVAGYAHHSGVTAVTFDPGGDRVISSGGDGFVKLWDAASGDLLQWLPGLGGAVRGVAVAAGSDGAQALAATTCRVDGAAMDAYRAGSAAACEAGAAAVRVWSLTDEGASNPRDLPAGGVDRLYGVAFSGDARWLAAAGCERYDPPETTTCAAGIVLLWDLDSPQSAPLRLGGQRGTVFAVDFRDFPGELPELAAGGEDRAVRIWNMDAIVEDAEPDRVLLGHRDVIQSLAFSPAVPQLAVADQDAIVGIWDLTQSEPVLGVLGSSSEWIRSIAFDPTGGLLASTAGSGQVRLWNMGLGGSPPAMLSGHENYVRALAFSPLEDPRELASVAEDGTLRVWTIVEERVDQEVVPIVVEPVPLKLSSVAWSDDGARILIAGEDGIVRIVTRSPEGWSNTPINVIPFPEGIAIARFAPSDDLVYTADASGQVRVWSAVGGVPVGDALPGEPVNSAALSMAVSEDDALLAVGHRSGLIRIWSLGDEGLTAEPLMTLQQGAAVWTLAFGPDDLLAAGGAPLEDGTTTRVWDLSTGEVDADLPALQDEVRAVAFSPDGELLVTGSKDQTVLFWDVSNLTGQPVVVQVAEWVRSIAWSPDGGIVAAPTRQGSVQTIDPDLEHLSDAVCDAVSENLSPSDWEALVSQQEHVAYQETCDDLPVPGEE